ncbi:hypothetical protein OHC33_000418 [Knufia fluminis]|uniref:Uncharacterized protein n=1 Tax=Knufia fluminis TaxID=191047 RepID=A0AAN8EXS4_9EURO|nr:hypothetical protein OHC33_000418 [Knufia fluminis]
MVLRWLLVSSQPLAERREYAVKKPDQTIEESEVTCKITTTQPDGKGSCSMSQKIVHGYGLDSTILRVCQQLCVEGWAVLYGENTITLRMQCDDGVYYFADNPWVSLLAYHDKAGRREHGSMLTGQEKDFALRFVRYHFEFNETSKPLPPWFFRSVLRDLASGLLDGGITAVFDVHNGHEEDILPLVKAFKLVRCKTLQFIGLPDTIAHHVENVTAVATGTEHVVDLEETYSQIFSHPALKYFMFDTARSSIAVEDKI